MKILKKILGGAMLVHVLPLIIMTSTFISHGSLLDGYKIGLLFSVTICIIALLIIYGLKYLDK